MAPKKIEPGSNVKVKGRNGYFVAQKEIVKDGEIVGWWVRKEMDHAIRLADLTAR